ncbi:Glycosyltransferase [hydrothermal vent metagenome]|uniref:Glycosyltransferase n=1 Tax=hydrothermal vent metagenome TaxID=652676 RepID=A0A3B1AAW2_9ZZZZ
MKIAQVSPLIESVPPRQYGGIERIVSYLTEELVAQGHDVTLFASGDSVTSARLIAPCKHALRLDACQESPAHHLVMFEELYRRAADFDIIHFHTGYQHFPLGRRLTTPHITTQHGRLDIAELEGLNREFHEIPVVSISDSQREPLPYANWQGTVYNGLPLDLYQYRAKAEDYLAFLGRASPEKGIDEAINIARQAGRKLKIAAKVDLVDKHYFAKTIQPLLKQPGVEFIGEINDAQKQDFLGNASALLFPISWPEPFGLVMTEAMACGTPVIAYNRGAVPEVIEHGVSGFIVNTQQEAIHAVGQLNTIDRQQCRQVFEQHFSSQRMTQNYLRLYEQQIRQHQKDEPHKKRPETTSHALQNLITTTDDTLTTAVTFTDRTSSL